MTTFFTDIPPIKSITEITNPARYHPVPEDWFIAVSDVQNSTEAIQGGKYKEVNGVAAASITALLNAIPEADLPYVFSGDGAAMLIPPESVEVAASALAAARELSSEQFRLYLRVGIIPVADVLKSGHAIRVAKLWMGENFQQAIFAGGGISQAESLLKEDDRYHVSFSVPADGNFDGFECRWNAVRSPYGETVSLIVQADDDAIYSDVLATIERIYGDEDTRHPITESKMALVVNPFGLTVESRVRSRSRKVKDLLRLSMVSLLGKFLIAFNIRGWRQYKPNFVMATDHEKFDDVLRMTIAGTAQQREELCRYLTARREAGDLRYGIHSAGSALVTCIVFDYFGRQVHLVDAAGGGYALASRQMKGESA